MLDSGKVWGFAELSHAIHHSTIGWEYHQPSGRAWNAIHRALSNGKLDPREGSDPLDRVVLGGRHLCHGVGEYAVHVGPPEVVDVCGPAPPPWPGSWGPPSRSGT